LAALNLNHGGSERVLKLRQTHATLRRVTLLDCPRNFKPHRRESKQEEPERALPQKSKTFVEYSQYHLR
jgi:hypothetical protein